jgi:hypothetical protein
MESPAVFPLLAIPLALGYLLARRLLKRAEWPSLLGESGGLAIVLTLIGVNAVYRQLGSLTYHGWNALELSTGATLALQLLLIAGLLWKAPKGLAREPLPRAATLILGGLSLLVLFYTNAQQIANPDDDFWIHAPLQGLMRHGNFPPFNPFFSDIAMNGHYGRNLGIVTFSLLSGADVFLSQHLMTSAVQVLTLWVFFSALRRSAGSWQAGLLATVFVFFGINAGGRGGLIDTMQNNNAFVHLYLALLLSLAVEIWQRESKTASLLCGLTLGSYAIVYETHFGLVALTIASLTPMFAVRRLITPRAALLALLALLVSLPLAFTQGGPLTDILQRRQEGRQHTQAEKLSKGMQNQAQVVKVTFPKKELFQILLETGEYQRVAHIYTLDTPLKALHKPSIERGYAYIWSWDVLKIHFLPLYLFPLSLIVLWRRGSLAGHFMGAFGVIAYLVPALVNFGPIYESEYYRWEFAASLGFSAALGLALAALAEPRCPEEAQSFAWRPPRIWISRQGGKLLAIALITLLNSYACLTFVGARMAQAWSGSPMGWLLFPSTRTWLGMHQVLGFDSLDYEAADWLSRQVQPGDRLLCNFAQENNFSILYESTLTGMTGARCVGHALPLEDEKIGTTPFRRAPAAVAFWQTFRGDPLSQLKTDWVLYRNDKGEELPPLPGAKEAHRVQEGDRLRVIYRIDPKVLPRVEIPRTQTEPETPSSTASGAGPTALRATLQAGDEAMRGGRLTRLTLQLDSRPSKPLQGVLELSTVRTSDGLVSSPSENLRWRLSPGEKPLSVPFVPPYDEGVYQLRARWVPDRGTPDLEIATPSIDVSFVTLLEKTTIARITFPQQDWGQRKVWPTRVMITPEVVLDLPPGWPSSDDVLACWAFYSPQRKEFDLLPGVNLQRVRPSEGPLHLPLITPQRPGTYRLGLYLSAGQGHLTRLAAGEAIVSDEPELSGESP